MEKNIKLPGPAKAMIISQIVMLIPIVMLLKKEKAAVPENL